MIVGYHLQKIGENSDAIGRVLRHPIWPVKNFLLPKSTIARL